MKEGKAYALLNIMVVPIKPNSVEKRLVAAGYREELIPYNLYEPGRIIELPLEQAEISGISYLKENTLVFVDDERGHVYTLDYQTGEVTGQYRFGKKGDFEDIEVVAHTVYVLRSDGNIYRIKALGLPEQRDKKYETSLTAQHDCEGLAYDPRQDYLLIACKSSPGLKSSAPETNTRRIWGFDLGQAKDLIETPVYILNFAEMSMLTNTNITAQDFQPSGIAVHPLSGDVYLISSVGNALIVLDAEDGHLIAQTALNERIFKQPEGICFSPKGTLFISNEGRGSKGNVLMFTMQ